VNPRAMLRLEALGKLRKKITSSGFELATFRLIAKRLDHLPYRVIKFNNNPFNTFECDLADGYEVSNANHFIHSIQRLRFSLAFDQTR
jgi:hypothetical protein